MPLEKFVEDALHTANLASIAAANALQQIAKHEEVCGDRYKGILHAHELHERRMDVVMKILWTTAGGVIMTLLAVVGALAEMVLKK